MNLIDTQQPQAAKALVARDRTAAAPLQIDVAWLDSIDNWYHQWDNEDILTANKQPLSYLYGLQSVQHTTMIFCN